MRSRLAGLEPGPAALLEVGVLFLPAIPAYAWLWPAVSGTGWLDAVQALVYLYLLAGALFIGLRRWRWDELGVNRRGFWFSLACGMVLLAGRTLALLSTNIPWDASALTARRLLIDVLFYFLLVGLVEELLFRGLVYRALDDWRGHRWAIWGSTLGFGIYHIGGSGLVGLAGGLILGAILGAMRWRAGGILGLIVVHGLIDLAVVEFYPQVNSQITTQVQIQSPALLILGYTLLMALVVYLWKAPRKTL